MSFFRYVGPNSPLPPAPKGDYGALSGYENPAATIHLTGSSPRTALIDGMFTYHPPASYRAQGQPSPPLFTDAGHVGASGRQETFPVTDHGQYVLPIFLCIEGVMESDSNVLAALAYTDALGFSDAGSMSNTTFAATDPMSMSDSALYLLPDFVTVDSLTGSDALTMAYVYTDTLNFSDSLLLPMASYSDPLSLVDAGNVVNVTGGSYSTSENFFVSDSGQYLLRTFSYTESFMGSDKEAVLAASNVDTYPTTDTAQQLKP